MNPKLFLAVSVTCILSACGGNNDKKNTEPATTEPAKQEAVASNSRFDLTKIPVSDRPLGQFPYLQLPAGYINFDKNPVAEADSAYFWVTDHFEIPTGKIFFSRVQAKAGTTYSDAALLQGISDSVSTLGGVKISELKVPDDQRALMSEANWLKFLNGYGFIGFKTTTVYVIRRADKTIWIQTTPTDDGVSAGWMILEAKN